MKSNTACKIDLDSLIVRPISQDEKPRWNRLVETHHYLESARLGGESLRYVAVLDNRWVALLGWSGAAFKLADRDKWIGWCETQRLQRFKYVVNNSRFLILPGVKIKNLASKVLALNLNRLFDDWVQAYRHPVVLAETFVDPAYFEGTSYIAAGFDVVGKTKGYGLHAGNYHYHGHKKLILVRHILKKARKLLALPFLSPVLKKGFEIEPLVNLNQVNIFKKGGLKAHLRQVPEWRKPKGRRHDRAIILALSVCAVLSGVESSYLEVSRWVEELPWRVLYRFGCRKPNGAPSEPTLRRSLQAVDLYALCRAVSEWLIQQGHNRAVIEAKGRIHALCQKRSAGSESL